MTSDKRQNQNDLLTAQTDTFNDDRKRDEVLLRRNQGGDWMQDQILSRSNFVGQNVRYGWDEERYLLC